MTPAWSALAPWLALGAATPALLHRAVGVRGAGWALAVAGYALAAAAGRLHAPAGLALVLLALVAAGWQATGAGLRSAAQLGFVLLAAALMTHRWPGFDNLRVLGAQRFTPDALPFSLYFNLDTPLLAHALLLAWAPLRLRRAAPGWFAVGLLAGAATATVCLGMGVAAGALGWAPKWPEAAWLWLAGNAAFTVLIEEAVFRGWLLAGLERRFGRPTLALGLSALVFGLAHAAGGALLVALAGLAGVGYGLAWRRGGLAAAMLAHLLVNLAHFGLLTYPARG
ncbi:CPBP family intramembrane glutamic endopeptidase [Derxia lacustris]|uniref:CPBP family intramembrane glutamic endopeptidase n=1 Tax=Derxia lacustris TaxID=764842 RepID=UPI000A17062F|nr:CPBP family intramembrane glutamic endopeptidase [Derxia lacustris]